MRNRSRAGGREKTRECDACHGACCSYVKIAVGPQQADRQRWARLHGIVIEGDSWAIPAPCRELTAAGQCGIYPVRPMVCREFEAGGEMCKAAKQRQERECNARKEKNAPQAHAED